MSVLKLLASSNFITLNKSVIKAVGLEEALLLGELCSEYDYWLNKDGLVNGMFFSTVENIEENTTLNDYKQRKALKTLTEAGLVEVKVKGIPAKRYFKINEEQVLKILNIQFSNNLSHSSLNFEELDVEEFKGNNNIINNNKTNNNIISNRVDYQQVVDMYNETCVSFPKLRSLSENRKKAIRARLKNYSIEDIQEAFIKAENSDFLKGANNRNWSADFNWIMKDANMEKILEGNYDNKIESKPKTGGFSFADLEI